MTIRALSLVVYVAVFCSHGFAQTLSAPLIVSFDQPGQFEALFEKPKESRISVLNLKQAANGGITGGCIQVMSNTAPPVYVCRTPYELKEGTVYSIAVSWMYDESLVTLSESGHSLTLGWSKGPPASGRLGYVDIHLRKDGRRSHQTLWVSGTGKDQTILATFVDRHWYRTKLEVTLLSRKPGKLRLTVATSDCGVDGSEPPISKPEMNFSTEREFTLLDLVTQISPVIGVGKEGGISCIDSLFASPAMDPLAVSIPVQPATEQGGSAPVTGITKPAPPQPGQGGLVLDRGWKTPIQGGSATMQDLGVLLSPFAKAAVNTAPAPGLKIYEGVTYLMPYEEARKTLNLTQKVISKNKVGCAGFPRDSFFHYAFDGNFEGHFNKLYIVTDKADQVVAVQLVSEAPKIDSNEAPYKATDWHTYNFVNSRTKATKRLWIEHRQFFQEENHWSEYRTTTVKQLNSDLPLVRIDSLLFNPDLSDAGYRGHNWKALEAVRLYLPRPMMELILHCIQTGGK